MGNKAGQADGGARLESGRVLSGRASQIAVVLFGLYAMLLGAAALSEWFGWGWFDYALFK